MADKKLGIEYRTMFKGGGSTQFKKSLLDIEKQLKEIESINKQFAQSLVDVDEKMLKIISTNEKLANKMQKVKPPKEATEGVEGLKQSFDNLIGAVKGFLALEITRKVIEIGKACLKASSDMTELQNVTDQVFGDMSKEVQQFSEDMGNAMGRSTYALQKYTSDIGSIFKGLGGISEESTKKMSEDLAALAVDIGSFKNIADDQAFTAITAGIVGETEPLKRLGVVINETVMAEYALSKGIKAKWETLDQATKAQLRYQKIMESTSFMQGDAARTINTYANQLKVFQANTQELSKAIGDKLVKSSNGCLGVINNLTEGLTRFFSKKTSSDFVSDAIEELNNVKSLLYEYKALSESQVQNTEDRKRMQAIVEQLKATYPQEMANVNSLKTNYSELSKAIDKVTDSIEKKMETAEQDYFNTQRLNKQKDTIKELENSAKLVNGALEEITKEINTRVPELKVKFNADDFLREIKKGTVQSLEDYIRNKFPKEAEKALKQLDGGWLSGSRKNIRELNFSVITSELWTQSEILKNFDKGLKEIDSNQKLVSLNSKSLYNSLSKSLDFSNELAQQNNRRIIEESRKSESDRNQKNEKVLTKIVESNGSVIETVKDSEGNIRTNTTDAEGNIRELSKALSVKEMTEVLNTKGVVTAFVRGVKTTYEKISENKYKRTHPVLDSSGRQVGTATNYLNKNQLKADLKIIERDYTNQAKEKIGDIPRVGQHKDYRNSKDHKIKNDSSSDSKGTKEKNKWEQMLENLQKSFKDLTTPLDKKIAPKIKELAEKIRKKQDEITDWLVSVGEIKGFEGTKEKIKHLEEQLKIATEMKDALKVKNIRQEIEKLKVENVLPELIGNINKELDDKLNNLKGLNQIYDKNTPKEKMEKIKGEIEDTSKKVEKYKVEKLTYYKKLLDDGKLTQSEYVDKQLELHKEIMELYKKYSDKASEIKEIIAQRELEVTKVYANIQNSILFSKIESLINNENKEKLNEKIKEIYKNSQNSILKIIEDTMKGMNSEERKMVEKAVDLSANNFEMLIKEIEKIGTENMKSLANLLKKQLSLKNMESGLNSSTNIGKNSEKIISTLNDLSSAFEGIAKNIDGSPKGAVEGIGKLFSQASKMLGDGVNIATGIATGNYAQAIQGGISYVSSWISEIVSYINFKDKKKELKEKREKIENDNKFKEELIKSNENLINSLDNNANEIRKFTMSLLKNVSANTSNENLKYTEKITKDLVKTYMNSFNPKVQIAYDEYKEEQKKLIGFIPLGWKKTYLGQKKEEKRLRELIDIPNFETPEQIEEYYKKIKDVEQKFKETKYKDKNREWTPSLWLGIWSLFNFKDERMKKEFANSNFEDILKMLPQFAEQVKKLKEFSEKVKDFGVLGSFDGIKIETIEEKKENLRNMYKKLAEMNGQNYGDIKETVEKKLNELVKESEVIVTAFDDVRTKFTQQLAQGNNVIDGLATALQGYFNKIRSNIAKVKYDLEFRDMQGFEKNFIEKFRKVSEELKKIRLENGKTLKDLNPKVLDFRDQFRQLNRISKVSTDMQNIIKELRRQAKEEGLSEEVIDKILPLGKVADKVKNISEMIKNALTVAIDTNSFDQFSMSLGDSLYKSVKESIIKAFVETTKFQELYKKYMDTEEYDKEIQKAKTMREAYDTIQKQLKKAELMLKAEGLGFRETNASNGEYLGGLTARQQLPATSKLLSGSIGEISTTVNIYNNGYLSTDSNKFVDDMTDQIIKKIDERKKKEV